MPTPTYPFTNLQFTERWEDYRAVKSTGAACQAYKKWGFTIPTRGGAIQYHIEFARCAVRVLGPYAIIRTISNGPTTITFHTGLGETIVIEPPAEFGAITVLHGVEDPSS